MINIILLFNTFVLLYIKIYKATDWGDFLKLNERGLLVIISGPSGVGKGTIRKALFEIPDNNFCYSVSMTTRKPREGEIDGQDYFFVSREEFERRIKENGFLEYAEFVGEYYGTPLDYIEKQIESGKEVIVEIEVQGALQVKERIPEAVFVFIVPPSRKALVERLKNGGTDSKDKIEKESKKQRENILLLISMIILWLMTKLLTRLIEFMLSLERNTPEQKTLFTNIINSWREKNND